MLNWGNKRRSSKYERARKSPFDDRGTVGLKTNIPSCHNRGVQVIEELGTYDSVLRNMDSMHFEATCAACY